MKRGWIIVLIVLVIILNSCTLSKKEYPSYKTKKVIIIVIDGVRYSESWGDSSNTLMPYLKNYLAPLGCINTTFYNTGTTLTIPGHTAIATGYNQNINNVGAELPKYHSLFQQYRQTYGTDSVSAWIISSKYKLHVLANCNEEYWTNNFTPSTQCGADETQKIDGNDSATFENTLNILRTYAPKLLLVSFKNPDFYGHLNNWEEYKNSIIDSDNYAYRLWQYLQSDTCYQNKTALFVTNDHGRHLDTISNGFIGHGDGCDGCRHLLFYANGPDFNSNAIFSKNRNLVDITATIACLLDINMDHLQGEVMDELFIYPQNQ